jgi:hypothetical protein
MSPDSLEDLRALWRDQPTPPVTAEITPEALRERAAKLARQSRRRNVRETVAGGLGAAATAWVGWVVPIPLAQIGCALLVLGTIWVLVVLWRRGRARPAPAPTAPTAEHLAHLRAELARERDLLGSVVSWYLAPLVPGLVLMPLGMILEVAKRAPAAWAWLTMLIWIACGAIAMVAVAWLNRRKSRQLAREIEALDAGGSR